MKNKILLLYDRNHPYQSIRTEWGLAACQQHLTTVTSEQDIKNCSFKDYDFVFVEASVDIDLSEKELGPQVILYDTEDKPLWFNPKKAYYSLKDRTKVYAKYNYQLQFPNKDGLKHIGLPQVDYINKGGIVAQHVYPAYKNVPRTHDIFFKGGPSYFTDYTPVSGAGYTNRPTLKSVVKKPEGTGHPWESDWLYNQRLEWVDQIKSDKELSILEAGFHYLSDPTAVHSLSLEYHMKYFGEDCQLYRLNFDDPRNYYFNFMKTTIGLNPAGVARSSYRIIELMALGRIIISTDMENYKYLYNPKVILEVPDGTNIVPTIKELKDNKELLERSKENMEVFVNITPQKMWEDFKKQI